MRSLGVRSAAGQLAQAQPEAQYAQNSLNVPVLVLWNSATIRHDKYNDFGGTSEPGNIPFRFT